MGLPWPRNGGLTDASSGTAVSRRIESKEKPGKATPRSAGWIAPRGEKQCADNFLRAKRCANEVRFILQSFDGANFPIAIEFSTLRNRASRINGPAISPHVDCLPLRRFDHPSLQ